MDISQLCVDITDVFPKMGGVYLNGTEQFSVQERQALSAKIIASMHRLKFQLGAQLEASRQVHDGRVREVLSYSDRRESGHTVASLVSEFCNLRGTGSPATFPRSAVSSKSAINITRKRMSAAGFVTLPRSKGSVEQIVVVEPRLLEISFIREVWPEVDDVLSDPNHHVWRESVSQLSKIFSTSTKNSVVIMPGSAYDDDDENDDDVDEYLRMMTEGLPMGSVSPDFLAPKPTMQPTSTTSSTTSSTNVQPACTASVAPTVAPLPKVSGSQAGRPIPQKRAASSVDSGYNHRQGVMQKLFEARFPNIALVPEAELEDYLTFLS